MYIVFEQTRYWHKFFDGKLSIEIIYYICLESLMNCVKYIQHCGKPVFQLYVLKSIKRSIIKYVSRHEHITYRDAYEIIHDCLDYNSGKCSYELKLSDLKEELEKPSKVFYMLKDESYDVDYIERISSLEFMKDYNESLEDFDYVWKMVMKLSFDIDGYRGLTNSEIADFLGISQDEVSNIRRRVVKSLRKDKKFNKYMIVK